MPRITPSKIEYEQDITNLQNAVIKPLWVNPNPSSSFAAQRITLSSADYDLLVFVARNNAALGYMNSPTVVMKGYSAILITTSVAESSASVSGDSGYAYMTSMRKADRVSDTVYSISATSYVHNRTYVSGRNDLCVPLAVYGLKFLSTS